MQLFNNVVTRKEAHIFHKSYWREVSAMMDPGDSSHSRFTVSQE